uniref:Uncharacterized protein n=1 Tax=viral metagenome TaxID=1070528 RepID=A0A6M3LMF0_9ZZZZ
MSMIETCRCKGTGWVKARIPSMFQDDYGGRSFGWAGCNEHAHLAIDNEPPADDSTLEPEPYDWEERP